MGRSRRHLPAHKPPRLPPMPLTSSGSSAASLSAEICCCQNCSCAPAAATMPTRFSLNPEASRSAPSLASIAGQKEKLKESLPSTTSPSKMRSWLRLLRALFQVASTIGSKANGAPSFSSSWLPNVPRKLKSSRRPTNDDGDNKDDDNDDACCCSPGDLRSVGPECRRSVQTSQK